MQTHLLSALLGTLLFVLPTAATPDNRPTTEDTVAVFRFRPGKLMFERQYKANKRNIKTLSNRLTNGKESVSNGDTVIRVYGFCNSFGTLEKNQSAAKNRSNQVKTYFILHNKVTEGNFRTTNSTQSNEGINDIVFVTFAGKDGQQPHTTPPLAAEPEIEPAALPAAQPVAEPDTASTTEQAPRSDTPSGNAAANIEPSAPTPAPRRGFGIAVKTNIPLLAATVANLGIEFSFGGHFSLDIPVIYSPYVVKRNYRLQMWAVQPEFRYWFSEPMHKHFLGLHAHTGGFNIAVDRQTRYQDQGGNSPLWGLGLSYGYVLKLARSWGLEFTLGAGYANIRYDSFYNIRNGAQIDSHTKHYWGLTRAGISVVYRIR